MDRTLGSFQLRSNRWCRWWRRDSRSRSRTAIPSRFVRGCRNPERFRICKKRLIRAGQRAVDLHAECCELQLHLVFKIFAILRQAGLAPDVGHLCGHAAVPVDVRFEVVQIVRQRLHRRVFAKHRLDDGVTFGVVTRVRAMSQRIARRRRQKWADAKPESGRMRKESHHVNALIES